MVTLSQGKCHATEPQRPRTPACYRVLNWGAADHRGEIVSLPGGTVILERDGVVTERTRLATQPRGCWGSMLEERSLFTKPKRAPELEFRSAGEKGGARGLIPTSASAL